MEKSVESITSFDKVIRSCVKEMETKHNCWIFILTDGADRYMSVFYLGTDRMEKDIKLCGVQESKYKTASAIRKHFR